MEEGSQTCANCDATFEKDGDQVTRFHVTIAETPYHQRNVSILEALATVCRAKSSKLGGFNKMIMCTRCATVVGDLYRSFVELMQLSKSTAYISKVLMQAEIWHRTRQATIIGPEVNPDPDGSPEEAEYNEDYLSSVLAVELTEGIRDEEEEEFSDPEIFRELQEEDESRKNNSSDDIRRIVPKKRKLSDSYRTSSSDLSANSNSRSRRKSAMPVKISPTEIALSPGGSDEGQALETNLRRSDRRRISSVSQSPDVSVKLKLENEAEDADEDDEFSDLSDPTEFEPPPKKKKKKATGRFLKAKAKIKGTLKRRRPRDTGKEDSGDTETSNGRRRRLPVKIPCTSCEKTFNYHWMLDQHVQVVHENQKLNSCNVCGFKFLNFDMFEAHHCIPPEAQAEEKLERPFRCKFCGKTLTNSGHFNAHCGSHDVAEDRRYKCPYPDCKLTFKFPKNLVKHERTHLEEKSWQCSICGKVFRVKRNLTIHMEIHKEEKKYLCPTCGERFAQRRGLFRHLNTHGSNLKHKCPICGKGFKRKDHVTQHLNSKVHPRSQLDGSLSMDHGLENNGILPLLTFDAEPADSQNTDDAEEVTLPGSVDSRSPHHGNSQPQLVSLHQPHTFISNPSVVLSQHPTEFAFSDLLTL